MSKEVSREEASREADDFPVLQHMLDSGLPLNRETYIAANWMHDPEEWTVEHEQQVPECFRDHSSLSAPSLVRTSVTRALMSFSFSARATETRWWPSRTKCRLPTR